MIERAKAIEVPKEMYTVTEAAFGYDPDRGPMYHNGVSLKKALEAALTWQRPVLREVIEQIVYDCLHSLSQPSMAVCTWGQRKDYIIAFLWAEIERRLYTRYLSEAVEPVEVKIPADLRKEVIAYWRAVNPPSAMLPVGAINGVIEMAYVRGRRDEDTEK